MPNDPMRTLFQRKPTALVQKERTDVQPGAGKDLDLVELYRLACRAIAHSALLLSFVSGPPTLHFGAGAFVLAALRFWKGWLAGS